MAILIINTGSTANAGNGDSLRTAFNKVNNNFAYLGSSSRSGPQGLIGFTGSRGNLGYTGSVGFTGSQGITGYWGSVGYTGSASTATGYTGSVGYTGSANAARDGGSAAGMAAAGFKPCYYNPTTGEFVYASS